MNLADARALAPVPTEEVGYTDGSSVLVVPTPEHTSFNDSVLIVHEDGTITEEFAGDGQFDGWAEVSGALVASFNPTQARAPKGTPIGGEWIDTPGGMLDDLKALPDARTVVREQGGASLDPTTFEQPTDGYMVAVQGHNLEVPEDEFFGPEGEDRLFQWIEDNREPLSQPGSHIGLWHDTENGEVVFDVSQRVDTVEEATRLGQERNQQAVWDVANGVEIPTGGTGDRQASASMIDGWPVHPPTTTSPSTSGSVESVETPASIRASIAASLPMSGPGTAPAPAAPARTATAPSPGAPTSTTTARDATATPSSATEAAPSPSTPAATPELPRTHTKGASPSVGPAEPGSTPSTFDADARMDDHHEHPDT